MTCLYFRGLGNDLFTCGLVSLLYLCHCQITLSFSELSSYPDGIRHGGRHFQNNMTAIPLPSFPLSKKYTFLAVVSCGRLTLTCEAEDLLCWAAWECAAWRWFRLMSACVPAATLTRTNRSRWITKEEWIRRGSRHSTLTT